jgi:hypothetical protein
MPKCRQAACGKYCNDKAASERVRKAPPCSARLRSCLVSSIGLPGGGEYSPAGAAPSRRSLIGVPPRPRALRTTSASAGRRSFASSPANGQIQRICYRGGWGSAKIVQVEPQVVRDLERVCTLCTSKRRCSRDFAKGRSASSWQAYCPNTMTLRALTADAGRSRL